MNYGDMGFSGGSYTETENMRIGRELRALGITPDEEAASIESIKANGFTATEKRLLEIVTDLKKPILYRSHYYQQVETMQPGVTVGVSLSDSLTDSAMLLQVGEPGNYTCAYLNDEDARKLALNILNYLEAK